MMQIQYVLYYDVSVGIVFSSSSSSVPNMVVCASQRMRCDNIGARMGAVHIEYALVEFVDILIIICLCAIVNVVIHADTLTSKHTHTRTLPHWSMCSANVVCDHFRICLYG
jgi:hypothetical protein